MLFALVYTLGETANILTATNMHPTTATTLLRQLFKYHSMITNTNGKTANYPPRVFEQINPAIEKRAQTAENILPL